MGAITVVLDDDLELKLRKLAMKKFGYKKGYLSKAVEEAVRLWIEREEKGEGAGTA